MNKREMSLSSRSSRACPICQEYSGQFFGPSPFSDHKCFFILLTMVLLAASACTFPGGYLGVDILSLTLLLKQNCLNFFEMNCVPLAATISHGAP